MKKILLFALVLALFLLFVGCTDSGKDKSAEPTETTDTDFNGGEQDSGGVELPIDHFGS